MINNINVMLQALLAHTRKGSTALDYFLLFLGTLGGRGSGSGSRSGGGNAGGGAAAVRDNEAEQETDQHADTETGGNKDNHDANAALRDKFLQQQALDNTFESNRNSTILATKQ